MVLFIVCLFTVCCLLVVAMFDLVYIVCLDSGLALFVVLNTVFV